MYILKIVIRSVHVQEQYHSPAMFQKLRKIKTKKGDDDNCKQSAVAMWLHIPQIFSKKGREDSWTDIL